MKYKAIIGGALLLSAAAVIPVSGQNMRLLNTAADASLESAPSVGAVAPPRQLDANISLPAALPRMSPGLALVTYEQRAANQAATPATYSDNTFIRAELPETSQKGEYALKRRFTWPRSLRFHALGFSGDGFVKTNVIPRLLQSEVEHVEKDKGAETAISGRNYKFAYKGTDQIDGREVHVFQVKPRKKRPGLFKGRIFLDSATGSLRRAEGTLVKTPSFFVKKVEFVQEYADVGKFTFPVRIHSTAQTRLLGRTIVDIVHKDYQLDTQPVSSASATDVAAATPASN
jgi:hypothetical protein